MKLKVINKDRASSVTTEYYKPVQMESTLRPIVLAHEIAHVKLGHTTKQGTIYRWKSDNNLLRQEMACCAYVLTLKHWSKKDIAFAFNALESYTHFVDDETKQIYQDFKAEYLTA